MEYKRTKEFRAEDIEALFTSVGWFSGRFPDRLQTAFRNSTRVISAWDGDRLVGLVRGLDDGVWQASIDCLLVDPAYQGQGIASALLAAIMEDYANLLYVDVVPDEDRNIAFYERHGFHRMTEGAALQYTGRGWDK